MREQSLYVKTIVMGRPLCPPYDWALADDWAGVMPPEPDVPAFLENWPARLALGTSRCECGHDWADHGGASVFGPCSLCDCNYFDDGVSW